MQITFPRGAAVDAYFRDLTVHTDQRVGHGGEGTGPEPLELFLASLGTCAGLYALRFCQQRKIDTTGLGWTLTTEKAPSSTRVGTVRIEIQFPVGLQTSTGIRSSAPPTSAPSSGKWVVKPPSFEVVAVVPGQAQFAAV